MDYIKIVYFLLISFHLNFQDSAAAWVKRQAKRTKEKAEADKRAKALAELDDEFGVGNLVKTT